MRRTEKYGWIDDSTAERQLSKAERHRLAGNAKLADVRSNEKDSKGSGRHSAR